jgi:hypothetical protein
VAGDRRQQPAACATESDRGFDPFSPHFHIAIQLNFNFA